jgi:hypothetical protein
MIQKIELHSVISKYFLNGLVESVKWVVKNNVLTIDFNSPNREMIGQVVHTNFPLPDSEIAIYNTSQLNKLLGITVGLIELHLTANNKIFTRLTLADKNFTLNYALADILLIQKPGKVGGEFNFEVVCDLTPESIDAIIKAKNALQSDNVIFNVGKNFDGQSVLELIFGENNTHTNNISYIIPDMFFDNAPEFKLPFDSEVIKTVLVNNKDIEDAKLSLNTLGLLKLEFSKDNVSSTYYITRKAEI